MKIERTDFENIAFGVGMMARGMAVAAATFGLSFCGVTTTMMRQAEKHPKVVQFVASLAAGIATNVVCNSKAVSEAITDDTAHSTKLMSDLIYGPSDEEEVTED